MDECNVHVSEDTPSGKLNLVHFGMCRFFFGRATVVSHVCQYLHCFKGKSAERRHVMVKKWPFLPLRNPNDKNHALSHYTHAYPHHIPRKSQRIASKPTKNWDPTSTNGFA